MIDYQLITPLKGNLSITSRYDEDIKLQQDKSLYKFIWVQSGTITVEIDHVVTQLHESEIITLTPLHHFEVIKRDGTYLTFVFNSNFYCIFGHDNEVSCNGFLFHGSSHIMKLKLTAEQSDSLNDIIRVFCKESCIQDNLQEEMLRILLKRFIITCARFAREKYSITHEKEKSFDMVRQFYVLVDNHYKEKKQVQEYADLLHRSPKTLTNLFASYGLPSPLRIIHERLLTEAKRLLLYTHKSAKEIADILGFEDLAAFSRFYKKMTSESITDYRNREKREK